ncbi:MAG: flagellar export chaperone FlgN [Eubacteriales bacterium]|nr:flagellar export chaperone FlgN [Eubacteriales bacterium]
MPEAVKKTLDSYSKRLDIFHDDLSEYLVLYQDLIPVLRKELDCIEKGNMPGLDECLKSLQALTLKTKGFEQLIDSVMADLGIQASTMAEAILKFPEEHRLRFYSLLGQFELAFKEIAFYRDECRVLLQTKLFTINRTLTLLNADTDMTVYSPDAKGYRTSSASKSFEQSI